MDYNNIHKNQICFILGSGTSLYNISKNKNFTNIFIQQNIKVMAINSSILLFPQNYQNGYFTSNDSSIRLWSYWNLIKSSKCKKIVRDSWKKHQSQLDDSFSYFSPRPEPQYIINQNDQGLCSISSVPSAIDLAIKMGFSKVYLLGLDNYILNGYSYFWEFWPKNKQPKNNGYYMPHKNQINMFDKNQLGYLNLQKFAQSRKCKIYCCNTESQVKAFQKINFQDIHFLTEN